MLPDLSTPEGRAARREGIFFGFLIAAGVLVVSVFLMIALAYSRPASLAAIPALMPLGLLVVGILLLKTPRRYLGVGILLCLGVLIACVGGCFGLIFLSA